MTTNTQNSKPTQVPIPNQGPGDTEEINFKDIFRTLLHHKGLILQLTLACLLAAGLYAFLWPKTYEASCTVKVPESSESTQNALRQMAFFPSMGDAVET